MIQGGDTIRAATAPKPQHCELDVPTRYRKSFKNNNDRIAEHQLEEAKFHIERKCPQRRVVDPMFYSQNNIQLRQK